MKSLIDLKIKNENIILIDGMNLFHRSYHKFTYLKNDQGYPTGAIFGFLNSLLSYVKDYQTSNIIICWEGRSSKAKRKKIQEDYKANRDDRFTESEREAFQQSLNDVMNILSTSGVPSIAVPETEADDVIYLLVKKFKKDIIIVSNDKDFLQLVNDKRNVKVLRPNQKDEKIYDEEQVFDTFKVQAKQIPLLLAIMGDGSDNVKGVKGYGVVKATKLINSGVVTKENFKKLFERSELRDFIKSYRLVKLGQTLNNVNIKRENIKGVSGCNVDEVTEQLSMLGIKKFNVIDLKLLSNLDFQSKLMRGL